jgi:tetratricopeptide (TPR) repeat protein
VSWKKLYASHPTTTRVVEFGICFVRRFERKDNISDLDKMKLTGVGHDPRVLNNLASCLRRRFDLSSVNNNLDRSIRLFERVRGASSLDDPVHLTVLYNLAIGLGRRFELLGNIEDLELAITANKEALELTPRDHPDRFRTMINQATYLELRFKHVGRQGRSNSTEGLDEAVGLSEQVLQEAPLNHPDLASWLEIHGNILGNRN